MRSSHLSKARPATVILFCFSLFIFLVSYSRGIAAVQAANTAGNIASDEVLPDLAPTALTAPAQAPTQHTVEISWTVKNQGNGEALPSWFNDIYLSTDQVWSDTDLALGGDYYGDVLASGASYTQKMDVVIPNVPAGNYYIILRVDRGVRSTSPTSPTTCAWSPSPSPLPTWRRRHSPRPPRPLPSTRWKSPGPSRTRGTARHCRAGSTTYTCRPTRCGAIRTWPWRRLLRRCPRFRGELHSKDGRRHPERPRGQLLHHLSRRPVGGRSTSPTSPTTCAWSPSPSPLPTWRRRHSPRPPRPLPSTRWKSPGPSRTRGTARHCRAGTTTYTCRPTRCGAIRTWPWEATTTAMHSLPGRATLRRWTSSSRTSPRATTTSSFASTRGVRSTSPTSPTTCAWSPSPSPLPTWRRRHSPHPPRPLPSTRWKSPGPSRTRGTARHCRAGSTTYTCRPTRCGAIRTWPGRRLLRRCPRFRASYTQKMDVVIPNVPRGQLLHHLSRRPVESDLRVRRVQQPARGPHHRHHSRPGADGTHRARPGPYPAHGGGFLDRQEPGERRGTAELVQRHIPVDRPGVERYGPGPGRRLLRRCTRFRGELHSKDGRRHSERPRGQLLHHLSRRPVESDLRVRREQQPARHPLHRHHSRPGADGSDRPSQSSRRTYCGNLLTVKNQGNGEANPSWTDRLYISGSKVLDGQERQLGDYSRQGPVASGSTYTRTERVRIPDIPAGSYYLILQADVWAVFMSPTNPTTLSPAILSSPYPRRLISLKQR